MQDNKSLLTFPRFPEVVGNVAHEGLEEENEADPLVPSMPDLVSILGDLDQVGVVRVEGGFEVVHGGDSRVRDLGSDLAGDLGGDGERPMDPAVGVHDA